MISPATHQAVLGPSSQPDDEAVSVRGLNCEGEQEITINSLINSFITSGFQATHLGQARVILDNMLSWRLSQEPVTEAEKTDWEEHKQGFSWANPEVRVKTKATIWLSFTSNMISSGLRENFVFLAKNRLIDVLVTSAGGVEEDFIKCLGPTVIGSFHAVKGPELRSKGWNRIGNLIVPNENYVKFEEWLQPLLDECLELQTKERVNWTPSKLIEFLGHKINDETSLYYWCAKNEIPVFCPGITDGSIGDNLYFHSYRNPGLIVDVVEDIRKVNDIGAHARKSGMIILGGGSPKHHVCNANLMRNGADFAVYINTANEFDGSDSGASPDEAKSWGKIRTDAQEVKVYCDATIAFPLLVATCFTKEAKNRKVKGEKNFVKKYGDTV